MRLLAPHPAWRLRHLLLERVGIRPRKTRAHSRLDPERDGHTASAVERRAEHRAAKLVGSIEGERAVGWAWPRTAKRVAATPERCSDAHGACHAPAILVVIQSSACACARDIAGTRERRARSRQRLGESGQRAAQHCKGSLARTAPALPSAESSSSEGAPFTRSASCGPSRSATCAAPATPYAPHTMSRTSRRTSHHRERKPGGGCCAPPLSPPAPSRAAVRARVRRPTRDIRPHARAARGCAAMAVISPPISVPMRSSSVRVRVRVVAPKFG